MFALACATAVLGLTDFVESADASFKHFDVSGFGNTYALVINNKTEIAGTYPYDEDGFVRTRKGEVKEYGVGGTSFGTTGINVNGTVVGYTVGGYPDYLWQGYKYYADGRFDLYGPNTEFTGINDSEVVVGDYTNSGEAFEIDRYGHETDFTVSGATWTEPDGINADGIIAGTYSDGTTTHGFIRGTDGTITTFDVSGDTGTYVVAINASGEVAGSYGESGGTYGFLRDSSGNVTTLNLGDQNETAINGVDAAGDVSGYYKDDIGYHGFLQTADGQVTVLDAPKSLDTYAMGMNDKMLVTGYFSGTDGGTHGFLWKPKR